MPEISLPTIIYLAPLVLIFIFYVRRSSAHHLASVRTLEDSRAAGLMEPPSLHPVIDPLKCIGCAACLNACPEMPGHRVLGMIHGKAALVSPADCIGHGACKTACPEDAITLVFGTETRGVDIPNISPEFETNIPGLFIAGELGGMGLIRNAIEQGSQAMQAISKIARSTRPEVLDTLIVGAGPAGISASLSAMEQRLNFVTIEQDALGGTVAHFPRRKLVMTAPATLPLVGKFRFGNTTKEKLLEFWQKIERDTGIKISYKEKVESIVRDGDDFEVATSKQLYRARTVLLAIGRRGTPRKLEVPGEDLPKVTYRLDDPEQYRGQHVLVVGGGDSAIEAACSIAEIPDTIVTLSYRSAAFSRAKGRNRERLEAAAQQQRVTILLRSEVQRIEVDRVQIKQDGRDLDIKNDYVVISAGGILPTGFLRDIGVDVNTKFGQA
jgi:thioredoxin reductase (NADPH)